MTNAECSGGQDRNTTTSEGEDHIPPQKTKNCYLTDGFDRSGCGTADDGACPGKGNGPGCVADDHGGYCKVGNQIWVSVGPTFERLSGERLLDRYMGSNSSDSSSGSSADDVKVSRALKDQERRFTNKIRELQIMGKNPLIQKSGAKEAKGTKGAKGEDNEVHDFVTDMLFNVGMGGVMILFFISCAFILIQNKII